MNEHLLAADRLFSGYDKQTILHDISISVPQNKISVILGANGCGKSTLLKTFARLLKPSKGTITLDGKHISSLPSRQLAQTLGLLPQTPVTPEGIKVTDLVSRGRFPYRRTFSGLSSDDFSAVSDALEISPELMKEIYGLDCTIIQDPVSKTPLIIPKSRYHR